MVKLKVGIIGCGAMGSELARLIQKSLRKEITIVGFCDHHADHISEIKKRLKLKAPALSQKGLIERSDLVIEAASAAAAEEITPAVLKKHKQLIVMSVGGLLKIKNLSQLVVRSRGRLWVPSGAVAGVDALLAAREANIKSVKLITRKPPRGLQGAPHFLKQAFPKLSPKKELCVFKGTAEQAVIGFPQNINVSAVLSLAGLGAKKTKVEIWTSKKYRSNQHEVVIESDSGTIRTITTNKPSPTNPKTSYLAILSVMSVVRKVVSGIQVGPS